MLSRQRRRIRGLLVASAVLALVSVACNLPTEAPTPTPAPPTPTAEPQGPVKGFGISPRGFPVDYSKFGEFLTEVGGIRNSGVMFNGAWRDDVEAGSDAGEIPSTAASIMDQSKVYEFTPIIVFGWRSDDETVHISVPANATDDWSNAEAKALFQQMLVAFAQDYQPLYLFLGNESDIYFTTQPEDYARWVDFYNQAYDAVKTVSPETMIGPIFQYERMSGQGEFSRWNVAQWGALEAHDLGRVDIVGVTVYPWTGVARPEDIPDDYFAPLVERIGAIPIAITETGWPSDSLGLETAWQASPDAQLRYVDALGRVLKGLHVEILNWAFLYPLVQADDNLLFWQSFGALGLYDQDGNRLPVYDAWLDFQP